jgi:peptidyl-dipeptidase A
MKTAASIVAIATMALSTPAWAKHHENDAMKESTAPTAADAKQFVDETEQQLFDFSIDAGRI